MKTSSELVKSYPAIARKKTSLPPLRMLLSGIYAGVFIAMGGLGSQIASTAVGGTAGRLAGACVFPVGLFLVVTVGVELFTGNCLLVIPLFGRQMPGEERITLPAILRNWLFVYIGNFFGSVLMALLVRYSGLGKLFDGGLALNAASTALAKVSLSPVEVLLRAILCNMLVCLAVWVAMLAEDVAGKAVAVFAPVMLFVLCGFEHSVANMYFLPLGMLYDSGITVGEFLLSNLLPVTVGNLIGGALCVGGGLAIHFGER